jgi:DNA-binding MarR family transcriptional regulator
MDDDNQLLTGPPPASLSGYTGYLLKRAFVRAQQFGMKAMPDRRHPRDLGMLVALDTAGPMSQRRLGELLSVNRTIMVKIADRLEADGLIVRERDPADRRNYALRTTPLGRTVIAEMQRGALAGEAAFTSVLTPAEHGRLVELLRAIVPDTTGSFSPELNDLSGFLIARAHLEMRACAEVALVDVKLTPPHVAMLTSLATIEPCSQQTLATSIGVSGPAIVRVIYDLEERGLISRTRNPADRREHLLQLTADGRTVLARATAELQALHQRMVIDQIGRDGMAELNALLSKLTT